MVRNAIRQGRRREAGVGVVIIALFLVILMGFVALVVDGGHASETQARCQAASDAAALAAAGKLPDQAAAKAAALSYAAKNMDPAAHGTVVASNDVVFGAWSFASKSFTPTTDVATVNAVRVIARRADVNSNPLPVSFGQVFGYSKLDVTSQSIAAAAGGKPWDLVLVQDVTSSFSGELSKAVTADKQLLDCFHAMAPSTSLFGLVSFTGWSTVLATPTLMGLGYATLKTAVGNIKSCGSAGSPICSGTDISAGLQAATNLLAPIVAPADTGKAIILVTDGQPEPSNKGSHPAATAAQLKTYATQWADNANAAGISLFVVFYNESHDATAESFLKSLIRGQGLYLSTPDPNQIPALLAIICGKLGKPQLVN
jgi:Flp pilus assembly protein TadG